MHSVPTLVEQQTRSSIGDGYTIHKDVHVPMRDGVELCVDIFLPLPASQSATRVPAICSMGPHGKDIHPLQFGQPNTSIYTDMFQKIKPLGPHACFELMDPLIWVGLSWTLRSFAADQSWVVEGVRLCDCAGRHARYRQ